MPGTENTPKAAFFQAAKHQLYTILYWFVCFGKYFSDSYFSSFPMDILKRYLLSRRGILLLIRNLM